MVGLAMISLGHRMQPVHPSYEQQGCTSKCFSKVDDLLIPCIEFLTDDSMKPTMVADLTGLAAGAPATLAVHIDRYFLGDVNKHPFL